MNEPLIPAEPKLLTSLNGLLVMLDINNNWWCSTGQGTGWQPFAP